MSSRTRRILALCTSHHLLDNPEETEETPETENADIQQIRDRSRWRKRNPQHWKVNVERRKRSDCLPYTIKKKDQPGKAPKPIVCDRCRFKCTSKITETQRGELCACYWSLFDFKRQKDFILTRVKSCVPERRRSRTGEGCERSDSKQYFFMVDGEDVRVCQAFFLKTLCISNVAVFNAFKSKDGFGCYVGEDLRGKHEPSNKTKPQEIAFVKQHIDSFRKVPSDYCRSTTQRQYLDPTLSISKMYALYREEWEKKQVMGQEQGNDGDTTGEKKKGPVSFITYKRVFGEDFNLSFFQSEEG
ncbi:hypothetical protein GE061_014845 [Apolygus lucorum]|uniref:Uncharacterized protein n=1 Tax=Apolygus lucorum TaxID=248454 RepID=A0A8S9XJB4_APOLU|nr:hypothetical protein GE061_014845 [Apolygus lucorum]